jgi:CUG-BP- and ETR3-like factor
MENPQSKDSDAIKLFIGQLPRSMSEQEAKAYFSEFGAIWEFTILRDRASNTSKGVVRTFRVV